jgi:DNA-binding transcriptional ArsR family regulator
MTEYQRITDSRVLASMAHPLRRRLLTLLDVEGPAMASTLAERTGQAVGNVSHHLKVLGAAGLIEEAPELARDRRERWWRHIDKPLRWSSRDFAGDAATEAIAQAAKAVNLDAQLGQLRSWTEAPPEAKAKWPTGPFATDSWMRLDDAELAEFGQELMALILRWSNREVPDDGRERAPVFVFAHAVPGTP